MDSDGLELALVFLLAAVLAVPLFKRLGLGAILAYLATGVLLGPHELAVVRNPESVLAASEIGVVMLLFVIGLELSLPRLKLMRKPIFGEIDMSSPFGMRMDPFVKGPAIHTGIDMRGDKK